MLLAALSVAVAVGLIGWVLPKVASTTLHGVGQTLAAVSTQALMVLTALWVAGLFVHSFVLTGALPGLTRRRALTMNLTGSAVSNVMPFGGATGMALNYVMVRTWGVTGSDFASYTLVTNVWVVLLKLAMPVVAMVLLRATSTSVTSTFALVAGVAGTAMAVVLVVLAVGLAHRRYAEVTADRVCGVVARLGLVLHRTLDPGRLVEAVLGCRDTVAGVVRQRGVQLSAGMLGYAVLQAALLFGCLRSVGAQVSPAVLVTAFAADRMMTLAVVTPGGLGFAEVGTTAALLAFRVDPAAAGAGVLLYRCFTYALEIPVGGTLLVAWLLSRWRVSGRSRHRAERQPEQEPAGSLGTGVA